MRLKVGALAALAACIAVGVVVGGRDAGAAPAAASAPRKLDPVTMWVRYPAAPKSLDPVATLGRLIFVDASLSASGKQACATCHDPAHAYGPPNGLAVQPGGAAQTLHDQALLP